MFAQTEAVIEKAERSPGAQYAPEKIAKAQELGTKAVEEYLISKGISADRLEIMGYGPSSPIAPNDTKEARAMNRRVELKVLEQ